MPIQAPRSDALAALAPPAPATPSTATQGPAGGFAAVMKEAQSPEHTAKPESSPQSDLRLRTKATAKPAGKAPDAAAKVDAQAVAETSNVAGDSPSERLLSSKPSDAAAPEDGTAQVLADATATTANPGTLPAPVTDAALRALLRPIFSNLPAPVEAKEAETSDTTDAAPLAALPASKPDAPNAALRTDTPGRRALQAINAADQRPGGDPELAPINPPNATAVLANVKPSAKPAQPGGEPSGMALASLPNAVAQLVASPEQAVALERMSGFGAALRGEVLATVAGPAARSADNPLSAMGWAAQTVPSPVASGSELVTTTLTPAPGHAEFADALGTQVAVWAGKGVQEAQLQLNPKDMGPVQVWISMDQTAAHIRFTAEHMATRDALQAALPELAQALARDGLQLGGASVQTSNQGGAGQGRQQGEAAPSSGRGFVTPEPGLSALPARAIGRPGTNLLDLYA